MLPRSLLPSSSVRFCMHYLSGSWSQPNCEHIPFTGFEKIQTNITFFKKNHTWISMSNGDFIKDFKRSEEWDRAQILQFILWICFIQIFSEKNGAYGPFLGPFSMKHLISSPSPLSSLELLLLLTDLLFILIFLPFHLRKSKMFLPVSDLTIDCLLLLRCS